MKFVIKSTGKMNLDVGVKSASTNGNGIFDKITLKNSKTVKKDCFDDNRAGGTLDIDIMSSMEVELGVDEFEELSKFCKENFEMEKDSFRFVYNGAKKFLDDLVNGIKNRGKEIVDAIGDVTEEYIIREAKCRDLEKEVKEKDK